MLPNPGEWETLASTKSESTSQIKNLVGGTTKNKRAARAARTLE